MSRIFAKTFPIDRLVPNPWNPNVMDDAMFRKELASLRKFGYVNPMLVRELANEVQVIDGEHRLKGLRQLGYTDVETTVIEGLTDEEAKQLTIVLNETHGRPNSERLGSLLRDLLDAVPKSDLLDVLPIRPADFDRLVGLEGFDWGSLGAEHDPASGGWLERTYRLPEDAALVIDQAIEAAKDGEDIPDWQALERVAADFIGGVVSIAATPAHQLTDPVSTAAKR